MLWLALALAPVTAVHALGLGRIKVHSALNEPLNAEIEITSATDKELKGLSAALAPRAEFQAAGIERLPYLGNIKFTIARNLDGRHVLQLNTEQPVDEPFLHMLLQVEWPGGRLMREYSALIDPPYQIGGKPSGIEAPRVASKEAQPPAEPVAEAPLVQAEIPAAPEAALAPGIAAIPADESKPQPLVEEAAPQEVASASRPETTTETPLLGPAGTGDTSAVPAESVPALTDDVAPRVEPLEPAPAQETVAETAVPATTPEVPAATATARAVTEYSVRQGDTLWQIAEKVRPDKQIAVEQVILAIYKSNRDAFFGNNVNNLWAGKILKLPEREQIENISASAARREFRAHYDSWQEYKLKLASAGRGLSVPVSAESAADDSTKATGKIDSAPAPVAKTAEPVRQPEELLKIVRADLQGQKKGTPDKKVAETETAKDDKERQALAERVATLEESLMSRQAETKDLSEKIGQVRAQLKRESRLIEIESQQLAQAAKKPAPVEPAPPPQVVTPAKTEPEKSAPSTPAPVPAPKVEASKPAAPIVPTPPAAEASKPPAPKKPEAAPAPQVAEKGFVDELLENELLPIVGGAIALLGGVIGFLYWRRRRQSMAEFEESVLASDTAGMDMAVSSASTSSDTTGHVVSAGDTSFLSDFSKSQGPAGMGHAHSDEVDPVAEAEVYLAYGRDETAEEILKDAISKTPNRHELRAKLLEIYHQRNDAAAFETLAEELYAALGGKRDKLWERVEEMGRKLSPGNPMFSGGAPVSGKRAAPAAAAASAPAVGMTQRAASPPPPPPPPAATEADSLDFDLGTATGGSGGSTDMALDFDLAAPPEAGTKKEESSIDFDLGTPATAEPAASLDFDTTLKMDADVLGEDGGAEAGLDAIDLGGGADAGMIDFTPSETAPPAGEPVAPPGDAGGGVDFDLDLGGSEGVEVMAAEAPQEAGGAGGQWDETATKLDLAKAYIDMGDAEGARSILDEVMNEGNDEQKKQASELAGQLG